MAGPGCPGGRDGATDEIQQRAFHGRPHCQGDPVMKKIPFVPLTGLFLAVLSAGHAAVADVAGDLKQAEELYEAGQYAQAEQLYQTVITRADPNRPEEAEMAFNARRKLPVLYLATDRQSQAQAAVRQLLARHADHERLPHAVREIVEQAKDADRALQAGQVYQSILAAQPEHPQAIWLKMGVAITNVHLDNDEAAESTLEDIIARHGGDQWAAEALAQTGWAYDKLKDYAKARPLYEYVADNWPDKPRAIYAHTALVRNCIYLKDKEAAQARLEQLVQRYGKDNDLPNVLTQIGRDYREGGMYEQAAQVSQYVLDHHPDSGFCILAQRDITLSEIALGATGAAQTAYDQLLGHYGNDGHLPVVLNDIAEGYRQAGMHGQAKKIAQRVLEDHPGSNQCLWAQRTIVLSDLASGDFEAGATGTQSLRDKFANQSGAIWAISEIAEAYGKLRRHEQARNLYKFNLEHYPNRDHNIWSLRGYIRESAALDDTANIEAGIATLYRDYATSKNLPMAAVHVGQELHDADHPRAAELFQYVLDKHPNHEQVIIAKVSLGRAELRRGQVAQAEATFQRILADHQGHPLLAEAIRLMAEGYYDEARRPICGERTKHTDLPDDRRTYMQKAIEKWALILAEMPEDPKLTPQACYRLGRTYYRMGEFTKAIEASAHLVDRWPGYENAWRGHLTARKAYKQLLAEGALDLAEALERIDRHSTALLKDYPGSSAARHCRAALEERQSRSDGPQDLPRR